MLTCAENFLKIWIVSIILSAVCSSKDNVIVRQFTESNCEGESFTNITPKYNCRNEGMCISIISKLNILADGSSSQLDCDESSNLRYVQYDEPDCTGHRRYTHFFPYNKGECLDRYGVSFIIDWEC